MVSPPNNRPARTLTDGVPEVVAYGKREIARAERYASHAAAVLREKFPGWTADMFVTADAPHWAIVKRADVWRPDLIVLGSHGRSFWKRLALGSISQAVLAHATGSIRIGRKCVHQEGPVRLLVGVDGSDGSAAAVRRICSRIWPKGTDVRVVSVIDATVRTVLPIRGYTAGWAPINRGADPIEWVKQAGIHAVSRLRDSGLESEAIICEGDPKRTLVEQAEHSAADCVFLGAKGLSRLERFLLGSVSMTVAAHAPCSVEVVRGSA